MKTLLLAVLVAESAQAATPPSASGAERLLAFIAVERCDDPGLGPPARVMRHELRQAQDMAVLLEDEMGRPPGWPAAVGPGNVVG